MHPQPEPMHSSPDFDPAVTVSALALHSIAGIHCVRFSLAHNPPPSPLTDRAKWLQPGVGSQIALPAAAISLLAESLPPALASIVYHPPSRPPKPDPVRAHPPSPPLSLWVFGTPQTLESAKRLLAHTFFPGDEAIWTPDSPPLHTHALTNAVHRAIVTALEAEGAVRVGNDILMPESGLSYSFTVSLGHGKNPHILIRLAVKHVSLRRVTDEDSAAALGTDGSHLLPVFAAPLGIPALLSKRPVAGDALTTAVIKRWREAGLLQPGPLCDSTVVFLKLQQGIEVPFPRAFVMTNHPKLGTADPASTKDSSDIAKSPALPVNKAPKPNPTLWKTRKRPRSPSALTDDVATVDSLIPKLHSARAQVPDMFHGSEQKLSLDAPTAFSLNTALQFAQKSGVADPVPKLHHPLEEHIQPPSLDMSQSQSKTEVNEKTQKGHDGNAKGSSHTKSELASNSFVKQELLPSRRGQPSASVQSSNSNLGARQATNQANGMDSFLLEGEGTNVPDGFDAGPSMDMTDFTRFDDDVTEFFRDGMEDRLQNVDTNFLQSDDVPRPPIHASRDAFGKKIPSEVEVSGAEQSRKTNGEAKMDIDSDVNSSLGDRRKTKGEKIVVLPGSDNLSPVDVVNVTLSALRRPIPSARAEKKAVRDQLALFFEEDLTKRRRVVKLNARRTISKRHFRLRLAEAQLKCGARSALEGGKVRDTRYYPVDYEEQQPDATLQRTKRTPIHGRWRSLYVPRRMVKTYSRLRRGGGEVNHPLSLGDNRLCEEEDSEADEESESNAGSESDRCVASRSLEALLCEPLSSNENGMKEERQMERDPLKIADSVAIDCASASYVLASDRRIQLSFSQSSSEHLLYASRTESGASPTGVRDDDVKSAQGLPLVLSGSKFAVQSGTARHQSANISSSPSGRSAGKKDREFYGLLSLLEMQILSKNELSLFTENPGETKERLRVQREAEAEKVSPATMRRVLLGLPRDLETSPTFGSCLASFRDEEADGAPVPAVKGPLSINDFLGGSASVFPLGAPRVCIGYNKEWMEASSGALPLWEKAGFEPYSERKNVQYVAVAPKELEEDVTLFLRDVSAAYEECSFGRHIAMPFDSVSLISNSVGKPNVNDRMRNGSILCDSDKKMVQQYHLAVTGICTKLDTVVADKRKNPTGSPTNIVAYIISPFEKTVPVANVALMRAVSLLVTGIPGTVMSGFGGGNSGPNLPAAPWRSSTSSKSLISMTIRIIPREVVDRRLKGHAEMDYLLERPLRPQLMKAVSFAVFNSIRVKRVRIPSMDGEVATMLSRASLMPDDLMSPMTPDMAADSAGCATGTPVSPIGPGVEDCSSNGAQSASFVDQSSALSPSFLHEPVVVLAGVGKHMGQTDLRADTVFHLAYAFCESSGRYAFAWTDQRGEILDMATVPVSKGALASSRRKAFWGMWARGQRWRISYVKEVHATISKLGPMTGNEVEDWDWVLSKVLSSRSSASADRKGDEDGVQRVVRRFPPLQQAKSDDLADLYTDLPTPATPGVPHSATSGTGAKSLLTSMDVKMPPVSSVSLLNVCNGDTHLFMEKSGDDDNDRRDFAIVSGASLSKGRNVQSNAILARFEDKGIRAIEVNVLRHYGHAGEGEEMSDERSPWDSSDVQTIAATIAINFHELRYVASAPSWPHKRWLSMYPVHLDAVKGFQTNLHFIQKYNGSASTVAR